jgi:hypothetical protein
MHHVITTRQPRLVGYSTPAWQRLGWAQSSVCDIHSLFQLGQFPSKRVRSKYENCMATETETWSRYVYVDYTFGHAMQHVLHEGVPALGLHYDIMCHYIKNMWKRYAEFRSPLSLLAASDFCSFLAAVPKFHLAGHTEGCFARFSLNYMQGVGHLDGEGGECCWSNLNHTVGSTSEKGPGARIDSLNHVMQQWNWTRIVRMRKYFALSRSSM